VKEIETLLEIEEENYMFTREEKRRDRLVQEGTYGGAAQRVEEIYGEMANLPEMASRIWAAGKETIFGRQLDPAAQEYLQRVQAKGKAAKPGASPAQTTPPRLIESE
jgi:hypothetical protein